MVPSNGAQEPGTSLVPVPGRVLIQIKGPDTFSYLQGLCTNDVTQLKEPSDAQANTFLTTQGRIISDALMYRGSNKGGESRVIIEAPSTSKGALAKLLTMYKLRKQVKIENLNWHAFLATGKDGTRFHRESLRNDEEDFELITTDPRDSFYGRVMMTMKLSDSLEMPDEELPARMFKGSRFMNGIGEGKEIEGRIPLEMNLDYLGHISFNKGCYMGQELIARTKYKGIVRKRLVPFMMASVHGDAIQQHLHIHKSYKNIKPILGDPVPLEKADFTMFGPLHPRTCELIEESMIAQSEARPAPEIDTGSKIYAYNRQAGVDGKRCTSIGEVIAIDEGLGLGLALVRVQALRADKDQIDDYWNEEGSYPHELLIVPKDSDNQTSMVSGDGDGDTPKADDIDEEAILSQGKNIMTFRPDWWPDLDPVTEKPTLQ